MPATESAAPKILDAKTLETLFDSDESFGIKIDDAPGGDQGRSVFPDGSSAIICTNYALRVKEMLPGHDVQVVGFYAEQNPDCAVSREDWEEGHDFAIVDHRYLVDGWAKLVGNVRKQTVYDLQSDRDAKMVADTYGNPLNWDNAEDEKNLLWDRMGTEKVMAHAIESEQASKSCDVILCTRLDDAELSIPNQFAAEDHGDTSTIRENASEDVIMQNVETEPAYQWQAIRYRYDDTRIYVDEMRPPFDGKPVLIDGPSGVIEAVWVPASHRYTAEGVETDGFYWAHSNGAVELDDVHVWHPLPNSKAVQLVNDLENFAPFHEEKPMLVKTKKNGWVEAWFDHEERVWQALDASFTLGQEDVTGWVPLPNAEELSLPNHSAAEDRQSRHISGNDFADE